jgi:hypothetical protein
MGSKPSQKNRSVHGYHVGDIYSFRTSPVTEFSAGETNRYAPLKVLSLKDGRVCYVVLDGIFDCHPDLAQTAPLPSLRNSRFLFHGQPACRRASLDWECDLEDFHYVGSVELSPDDIALASACRAYGTWNAANSDAEGEWRWRNDRGAYQDEVEREQQARDARAVAERERYEKHLKTLTWENLLEGLPFVRWDVHPPFPPPDFVAAARDRIRSAILELQALGPNPKKAQVRAALKICVEWFNAKDAEFGHVIETEEREDICVILKELAVVAQQRSLIDDIHAWRNW